MAATKRKRPVNDGEQEPSRFDKKERPKGTGKGQKIVEKGDNDDTSVDEEADCDDDDGDYEDSRSQKKRMILFEQKLKAIKKQKKASSESNAIKFRKKIKLQEETLINSLQQQKTKIKSDASAFSKTLTTLLHSTFRSSPPGLLAESLSLPDLVQNHRLHISQLSIATLSARLLASAQSLRETLTTIADGSLTLGGGWEQDGDLSIRALRQAEQSALLNLKEMISGDEFEKGANMKGEVGKEQWKRTVKRSTKGISRLLKNLPVPTVDQDGE